MFLIGHEYPIDAEKRQTLSQLTVGLISFQKVLCKLLDSSLPGIPHMGQGTCFLTPKLWAQGLSHPLSDLHWLSSPGCHKGSPLQIVVSLVTEPHQIKADGNSAACKALSNTEGMALGSCYGWGASHRLKTACAALCFVPSLWYSSRSWQVIHHIRPLPDTLHSRQDVISPYNSSALSGPGDLHVWVEDKSWLH